MMLRIVIVSLAVMASGCSGLIDQFPTTPDPVFTTETFSGTLSANSGQTHSFGNQATGTVTATLTSLGDEPPARIGFALGTLSASGACTLIIVNDAAAVNTVVTGTVSSLQGALCARIYDTGALAPGQSVPYVFTVTHP